MTVARLTAPRIREMLAAQPGGLSRARLLEHFASIFITPRAHRGAKGRLGGRLSREIEKLVRHGQVAIEGDRIRLSSAGLHLVARSQVQPPPMSVPLRRAWFAWLLAEDRPGEGAERRVDHLRESFIRMALTECWTAEQVAMFLRGCPEGSG